MEELELRYTWLQHVIPLCLADWLTEPQKRSRAHATGVAEACRLAAAVILRGPSCLETVIFTFLPLSFAPSTFISFPTYICIMNPVSNKFDEGLPKGKANDPRVVALSPPSTPSPQEKNLPPLPPLSEWPPPLEQPRHSIGTPTSITTFEPFPKAELSPLTLLYIRDTDDYITTSTTHSRVSLADVAVEEPTDTAVTFDNASPHANHNPASNQEDSNPPLPPLKERPPPSEHPQLSIATATSITSSEPLPGLSSLPIPPISDKADHSPTATINSRIPRSDVAVDVSADSDSTAFDIASPRVDQDLAERSPRENGSVNINTSYGDNDALPSQNPFKLDCKDDESIDQSLFLTLPPCWSEGAEGDLVTHLGPSERSRQEIMWEIVKSEER